MVEIVLVGLLALVIGVVGGYFAGANKARELNRGEREEAEKEARRKTEAAEIEADKILKGAREESRELIRKAEADAEAEAKAAALKAQKDLKANLEREQEALRIEAEKAEQRANEREQKFSKREGLLDKRDENLDRRAEMYDGKEQDLNKRDKALAAREQGLVEKEKEIDKLIAQAGEKLSEVAGLSPEEARRQLIEKMTGEARIEGARLIKNIEDEAIAEADRRAKKVIGVAIQRYAGEYVAERTVTVLPIPNDDIKGRIIGREGRNIRALEAATGINLIIDDTPEAVVLSGFNPVAREVARISLERLIADGRIHPSRIEEVVEKTRGEVDKRIKEAGEQAAFELGLHNVHPELLKLVGQLRYRTSYGQNQWKHSIEVGFLCGMMASELGLNTKIARRAGLLHDIGKAVTHEMEGSHAVNGGEFCRKFGEDPIVINAVAAHHDDVPPKSVYAHLVMGADALSGARPGARREILETYIRRLEDLERISCEFEGVEKCYAVQAGREIRVIVENDKVNDEQANLLSKDIARRIEKELTYPGQIKVCVIRELRAVDYAR